MAPPLKWATWALAVSHSRGHPGPEQEAAEPVKWEDLMVAASRFPRFFGSPARVPRTDPPKVAALSYKNFPGVQLSPFGKIEPMHCSSDSGNFACAVDCKCANPAEKSLPAYVTLQERNSSLSHHIDGLDFISDYWLTTDHTGHKLLRHFFTQTLDGKVPIDNTQVILALNKNDTDGNLWEAPERGFTWWRVYDGKFDDGSTSPTCNKYWARDIAARVAFNQPNWYGLYPEHMKADTVYTVQDGRLYLTWRLRFDTQNEVADDFYVWINARNCSEVVAVASAKQGRFTKTLDEFKKEQVRLFKEMKGIDLDKGVPPSE